MQEKKHDVIYVKLLRIISILVVLISIQACENNDEPDDNMSDSILGSWKISSVYYISSGLMDQSHTYTVRWDRETYITFGLTGKVVVSYVVTSEYGDSNEYGPYEFEYKANSTGNLVVYMANENEEPCIMRYEVVDKGLELSRISGSFWPDNHGDQFPNGYKWERN